MKPKFDAEQADTIRRAHDNGETVAALARGESQGRSSGQMKLTITPIPSSLLLTYLSRLG